MAGHSTILFILQVMSVRVRHILVSTKEMAEDLFTQLKANADFEELARAISGCEFTRESGGEVRNAKMSHGLQ
jgi:parvulin-like peptidyl-prolyl isomerase